MNFNDHSRLAGKHAFLGASQYHWLNYSEDKVATTFINLLAKECGTRLHEFAKNAIELGIKLPKSNKTLNAYVNDAIGFKMIPEQVLYYSDNCFGTCDAIAFKEKEKLLRISDLKTGAVPAHMEQLLIYTALFCLEYKYKPSELTVELRIYQNDEIIYYEPAVDEIVPIMDKIVSFDKLIEKMKMENK